MILFFVGLDLGGTTIGAGVLDENGNKLSSQTTPVGGKSPDAVIRKLAEAAEAVVKKAGKKMSDIQAIGIGSPGLTDNKKGIVQHASNFPEWKDVKILEGVKKLTGVPCVLEGDAKCAAAAECWIGVGKELNPEDRFALLTLGTGIGGGVVVDGRVLPGWTEPGHMIVEVGGRPCGCGQQGCLERYCSAAAVARIAKQRVEEGAATSLSACASIGSKEVFDAASKGDAVAAEIIKEAIHYLAVGCIAVSRVLDPQAIALGGGMAQAGDQLFAPLRAEIKRLSWSIADPVAVVPAKVGRDAGMVGAAYTALLYHKDAKARQSHQSWIASFISRL